MSKASHSGRNIPLEAMMWLIGRTNHYSSFTRNDMYKAIKCNRQSLTSTLEYLISIGLIERKELVLDRGRYNQDKTKYAVVPGFFDNIKQSGGIKAGPLFEQELMQVANTLSQGEWVPGYRQYESYMPMYVAQLLNGEYSENNKEQLKTFSSKLKAIAKTVDRIVETEPGTAHDKELARKIIENLP